jgi:hypothetical protein
VVDCLFSGNAADTREHVIPDWLQRRFQLQTHSYRLPNETSLDYRHATVRATNHDNKQFGQIEARISRNQFVWEEVYLWLFKIHIGLMVRDVSLRFDIRDPESGAIIPVTILENQLLIFRELYRQYFTDGQFHAHRSPPGSVFILPSLQPGNFDFVHSFTCGCLGVNVGEYFLAASLWDFGMAKDFGYFDWVWSKDNYGAPPADFNNSQREYSYNHTQRIWLCGLGHWCLRWNINMYNITREYQPGMPSFNGEPYQRAEDRDELSLICGTFGLRLVEFIPDGKSRFSPAEMRPGGTL